MKTFIVHPLVTEKSIALTANGVYQFIVPRWVNKRQIAEQVSRFFNVTVETVNTANYAGRIVTFKRKPGVQSGFKKATVVLKKGDTIAQFSLPVEEQAPQTATTTKEQNLEPKAEPKTESKITVRSRSKKSEA